MKSKLIAALLAFPFGIFGLHRFYLGQRLLGFMYFGFSLFALVLTIAEGAPVIAIAGLVALMDAILLLVMPKAEFDDRYNRKKGRMSYQAKQTDYVRSTADHRSDQNFQYFKRKGINAYRNHNFVDAVDYFNDALDLKPEDPAMHFNLACCHSKLREPIDAFFHLEKAVEYGFDDLDKIHTHEALAFLRTLEDFDLFVSNGYQSKPLDLPQLDRKDELLEQLEQNQSQQLLDKLKELADLRDKGILTEEEFAEQKRRLLRDS